MGKCPTCGSVMSADKKFCVHCGTKLPLQENQPIPGIPCPVCGKIMPVGKKFCINCGTKLAFSTPEPKSSLSESPIPNRTEFDLSLIGSMIHWNVLPGQLAVKIEEKDIASYGNSVKGINIQNGVQALFFVRGKLVSHLDAGAYSFKEMSNKEKSPETGNVFWNFLRKIANFFTREDRARAEAAGLTARIPANVPPVSMVLVRTMNFPLIFNLENVQTSNLSCNIGLHLLCRITNIDDFYAHMLLDSKMVTYEKFNTAVLPFVQKAVNQVIAVIPVEKIDNNSALQEQLLTGLQNVMQGLYPFVAVEQIVNLSAANKDISNLRRLSEELYVSEQELNQATLRNEFTNRLQAVKDEQDLTELKSSNAQELATAQIENQFVTEKNKIYEAMALTEDQKAQFDLMLSAQRQLREAKSENDVAAAMLDFEKSGLFRQQELDNLKQQISHDAKLKAMNDLQLLNLTSLQNQQTLDQQKADWEMLMGKRRTQEDVEQQRIRDSYHDERRNVDAQFEDSRVKSQIELDRERQQVGQDMLRQAQTLRMEQEDAEHRRDMETLDALRQAEKQRLDAEHANLQTYAGMSAEQIMAANPNISEHAARALAEKFSNDNAVQAANEKVRMTQEMQNQMNAFMQHQMQNKDKDTQELRTMMLNMMQMNSQQNMTQMQMMRDQAAAFAGADQKAQQQLMDAKQQELEHIRAEALANNDRFVDGMKTTISAVSATPHYVPIQPIVQQGTSEIKAGAVISEKSALRFCPKCHASVGGDDLCCGECGQKLN